MPVSSRFGSPFELPCWGASFPSLLCLSLVPKWMELVERWKWEGYGRTPQF